MTPHRFAAEQFVVAFLLAATGVAVAVRLIWRDIDQVLSLPRLPR